MTNTRRVAITIDADLVAATLSGFPVLLTRGNFPDEMFAGGNAARSDGGDLRFYTDSGGATEIAREIAAFSHGGAVEVWVKIPSLSSATDTTIYCQYGDGALTDHAAGATYGRDAVWSDKFLRVWHLNETPAAASGVFIDATGSGDNLAGQNFGGDEQIADGPWSNKAVAFRGDDRGYSSNATLASKPAGHDFSVSFWARRSSFSATAAGIAWDGTDDLIIYPHNATGGGQMRVFWRGLVPFGNVLLTGDAGWNIWHRCDFTSRAGDDHEGAMNAGTIPGAPATTSSVSGSAGPFSAFYVGGWSAGSQDFDGDLSEVRVSLAALSNGWMLTEYVNQSDPAAFASAGTPEAIGVAPVELAPASAAHAHVAADITVAQVHVVDAGPALHAQNADIVTLAQMSGIIVADAVHSLNGGAAALAQLHVLWPQASAHAVISSGAGVAGAAIPVPRHRVHIARGHGRLQPPADQRSIITEI